MELILLNKFVYLTFNNFKPVLVSLNDKFEEIYVVRTFNRWVIKQIFYFSLFYQLHWKLDTVISGNLE